MTAPCRKKKSSVLMKLSIIIYIHQAKHVISIENVVSYQDESTKKKIILQKHIYLLG